MNSDTFGSRFGALIKRHREAQGLSLANVAVLAYGDDSTNGEGRKGDVQKLENGNSTNPRAATIERFCTALNIPQAEIDALRTPAEQSQAHHLRRLVAEKSQIAAQKEITELQVITLAERIAEKVPDFPAAVAELDDALTLFAQMRARGNSRSNHDEIIDAVLAQLAERNADGDLDGGAEILQDTWAAHQAAGARILDELISQHRLRRDVEATAAAQLDRLRLDHSAPAALFEALAQAQTDALKTGKISPARFDLECAIALGHLALDHAPAATDRARIQNNLGSALRILGAREEGTARLEEAVTAYRSALEVYTRDALPLDWAMTQENLAIVLLIRAAKTQDPADLIAAQEAVSGALEVYQAAGAAYDIGTATRLRDQIARQISP